MPTSMFPGLRFSSRHYLAYAVSALMKCCDRSHFAVQANVTRHVDLNVMAQHCDGPRALHKSTAERINAAAN